jgi:predicted nucleic acid-binding protein
MVLIDTSIWIASTHKSSPANVTRSMRDLLRRDAALAHDFVHGELLLGKGGRTRQEIVELYARLKRLHVVSHDAALAFAKKHKLDNRGLGWVDVHLLAAAYENKAKVWTNDKEMKTAATELEIAYAPTEEVI